MCFSCFVPQQALHTLKVKVLKICIIYLDLYPSELVLPLNQVHLKMNCTEANRNSALHIVTRLRAGVTGESEFDFRQSQYFCLRHSFLSSEQPSIFSGFKLEGASWA